MFWIILTILIAALVAAAWFIVRPYTLTTEATTKYDPAIREHVTTPASTSQPLRRVGEIAAVALLVVWALLTVFVFSMKRVAAGEVGIERQFGSIVGQRSEGVSFIAPWRSIDTVSIRTERQTFGTPDAPITAASNETQDVYIIATINYSVSEANVQDLIRDVGTNWFDVLVPTRVNQYIKQETAKWATAEIIPNREAIRQAVLARLRSDLGENYSITISDLLLDNISFSPEYTQAIEDKQVATEQAQAEENRTETVRAQAEQRRVQAQGEADAQVIAAQDDDETVHHRNGDKQDNRWENLEVLTRSAHAVEHAHSRPRDGHGRFVGGARPVQHKEFPTCG